MDISRALSWRRRLERAFTFSSFGVPFNLRLIAVTALRLVPTPRKRTPTPISAALDKNDRLVKCCIASVVGVSYAKMYAHYKAKFVPRCYNSVTIGTSRENQRSFDNARFAYILIAALLSLLPCMESNAGTIAFLYALDADLASVKGESPSRSYESGGTSVQEFQVGKHKVRAAKMGAGNVDTAISTANLLGRFPADLLVSVGPSGALTEGLRTGEWFRVKKVVGYQRGSLGNAGWVVSPTAVIELAVPEVIAGAKTTTFSELGERVLASGDAFVANDAEKARVREIAGADAVDMNSFGLVVAAAQTKTPLVIWKVVSDGANAKASDDFKAFIRDYKGEGGQMVRALLLALPTSPASPESYEHIRDALGAGDDRQVE